MKFRIVVVGAGVAGSIITSALRYMPGIDIICLELTGPHDHMQVGNGLNIGPNALHALDLTMPTLAASLREVSLPWKRWIARLADGSEIYHTPLDTVADRNGIRIRWSELYRSVRADAGNTIQYHNNCVSIEHQPDGRLKVYTLRKADGITKAIDDVDLVIAGDGRYSSLRAEYCGLPHPRHLGVTNFRLLVDDHGSIDIDDMEQWFNGPRRLIAFRLPDGLLYLSGNFPIDPGAPTPKYFQDPAFLRTAFIDSVALPDPRLDALSEAIAANADTMHWARAQDIDALYYDDSQRILFIGDASHAMCPTLGQGATQAIEDAAAFVALAREASLQGRLSAASLCVAFALLRQDRIDFVKKLSWDASEMLMAGADPVSCNRRKTAPEFMAKLEKLYNNVPVGRDRIRAALALKL